MAELDIKRWVVLDAKANRLLWEKLMPGAEFLSVETLQTRQAELRLNWTTEQGAALPHHPQLIVIHADSHIVADPTPCITGIDWAMRLREEPNRFHCPILLLSFQELEYAQVRELQDHGTELLRSFLTETWQVRWHRLPLTKSDVRVLAKKAIEAFEAKKASEAEWRELARSFCKGQIERIHRRYRHGRGSFTTALWLLSGAVQNGALSPNRAIETVNAISGTQEKSEPYDFSRFCRYISLLQRRSTQRGNANAKRNLLLIEDEFGWADALRSLLPEWTIAQVSDGTIGCCGIDGYDLIFLDENLGAGCRSGLDVIADIRATEPLIPVIFFTSNRDPAVSMEALRRGATDILLKQSSDTDERDAIGYHRDFVDTVNDYGRADRAVVRMLSGAWKTIVRLQPPTRLSNDGREQAKAALQQLRSAFLLTALCAGVVGARRYDTLSNRRAAQILLTCATRSGLWASGAQREESDLDALFRDKGIEQPNGIPIAKSSDHGNPHSVLAHAESAAYCAALSDLLVKLGFTVSGTPYKSETKRVDKARTTPAIQRSHDDRSLDGAIRFLEGSKLSAGPMIAIGKTADAQMELLVVDDTATDDGWIEVLQEALPKFDWNVQLLAKSLSGLHGALHERDLSHSTILLDLRLPRDDQDSPDEEIGEECLKIIREEDSNVPIIIFSASASGFKARRCLRPTPPQYARAQAYFAKTGSTLPTDSLTTRDEYCKRYFDEFLELLDTTRPVMALGDSNEAMKRARNCFVGCALPHNLNQNLSRGLGVKMKTTANETLWSYLEPEFNTVLQLAWAAEDPYCRFLSQRLFSNGREIQESARAALLVGPAALIESMFRLLFAIAWNDWAVPRLTASEYVTVLRRNREYFELLDSDEFDEAWLPIFSGRNAIKHQGSIAQYPVVEPICRAVALIADQLHATAIKCAGGRFLQGNPGAQANIRKNGSWKTFKRGATLDGVVVGRKNEGFQVDINGIIAFWPEGRSKWPSLATARRYRGKSFEFKVIDSNDAVVLMCGVQHR